MNLMQQNPGRILTINQMKSIKNKWIIKQQSNQIEKPSPFTTIEVYIKNFGWILDLSIRL